MTLPKIILILGGAATMAGVGAFLMWGDSPNQSSGEAALLKDYQEFLEDLKNDNTEKNLSGSCDKPEKFASQIKDLEDRLKDLQDRKNDLLNSVPKLPDIKDEDIIIIESEPRPGSELLELSDGDYSDPIPGSQVPELLDYYPNNDPRPGSEPPELLDYYPNNDPRPGSQVPDLSDGDYSDPRPGSQVPEMSDGNYFNEVPELPEIVIEDSKSVFDQIDEIEQQIITEINNLKSLCDEDEVISDSCPEACKKYGDCARYTEDVTEQDIQDAYDSCMEECVNWSKETVICINKKPIKKPLDCRDLSFCALPEYGGPGWKF